MGQMDKVGGGVENNNILPLSGIKFNNRIRITSAGECIDIKSIMLSVRCITHNFPFRGWEKMMADSVVSGFIRLYDAILRSCLARSVSGH